MLTKAILTKINDALEKKQDLITYIRKENKTLMGIIKTKNIPPDSLNKSMELKIIV